MRHLKLILSLVSALLLTLPLFAQSDTTAADSSVGPLHYPLSKEGEPSSPLQLKTPDNRKDTVIYDAKNNEYIMETLVGDMVVSRKYLTFDEYQEWQMQQVMNRYWSNKIKENNAFTAGSGAMGLLEKIPGFNEISRKLDALDGKPLIDIKPSGSADLTFQGVYNYRDDPQAITTQRRTFTFDFDENIQMNMGVKIGDLVGFDLNWNTQATFNFENKIKLKYEGKEDDILQLFEAADISFPLNTTLIKGSQELFGFHTKMKFGKVTVDLVASQKETSTQNMQIKGGASTQEFEIGADEYEENRHYFISQYFYENYNKALSTLPQVNSNVKIIRMEVWRTNVGSTVNNNRNLLALTDLGEYNPSNSIFSQGTSYKPNGKTSNNVLQIINAGSVRNISSVTSYMQGLGLTSGKDYEKIESARLLNSSEYTYNSQLGFISLNQALSSDQMLAVAFQYQVIGDTTIYQVGELTTDGVNDPNVLIVKLLKSTTVNTRGPLWKLMMKNVYFLKSTQISKDNFRLNILYEDPNGGAGIGYFTDGPKSGLPLIEVFGLDRMDASLNYKYADGVFDWMDSAAFKGGIIQPSTGRIYFPYVEPFGKDLRALLGNDEYANKYCFDSLYTMTQTLAQQYADKNKFHLEGYFSSSVSGDISLGYSVTSGSVTVTAGGVPLIENVDYTVDYTMGVVHIINESILSSGTPISVSSENNSFSMMTKRMLGAHINYEAAPDFNIGATFMNLREKPLTQKNNFGEEPTSNSIYGFDLNYKHDVPLITRLVDMLPGIQTKAPSTLTLQTEFAQFVPGIANTGSSENGVSYIDDFEGAESSIDLKTPTYWHLASTPQDYKSSLPQFPETRSGTGWAYNYNRALTAWYRIDNIFYSSNCPDNIDENDRSKPYVRHITEQEVFPNKSVSVSEGSNIYEMNLAFYPGERGPYNYDVAPGAFSAGVNSDGTLANPETRWGGIMRSLDYTDFETQNIETIEFWLMDPFLNPETGEHDDTRSGGKFYIDLGDISEDILRDGKKFFENGLPLGLDEQSFANNPVDTTIWGRVPKMQSIVNAFSGDETTRKYQDVGLDGLGSTNGIEDERSFFANYLQAIAALYGTESEAYKQAYASPSSDDFHHFRGSDYDNANKKIQERYKYYNNPEGNSCSDADNPESYSTTGTSYPDIEDINKDNTLSETENYYQYEIDLEPGKMQIGSNHIVDIQEADNVALPNGTVAPTCRWYQFSIPIREPDKTVGDISGFQSIRFMRMFLSQFKEPVVLRFATLELVYGTWRKYSEDLLQPGDYPTGGDANTSFNIGTVNIEENGSREPVPYVLPPGIEREEWYSTSSSYTQLDEQSEMMDISNLSSGDARAIYRNMQYDLRFFGKLKMFVHAEKKYETDAIKDNDMVLFVRLGTDYTTNYYEYEVPLKLTPWGTSSSDVYSIWPEDNNVEIDLQKLVDIKTDRNKLIRSGNNEYGNNILYNEVINGHKYSVLGTPNLGKVKVIMIGVRNPKKETLGDGNDMLPKNLIVWVNELRLSDYLNNGGWAAMALARTNLADLGSLSFYGNYSTAGFGNLEDNLNKLELSDNLSLQTTLSLELGKFLPEKWGVHIPFYLDRTHEVKSPQYNPLDPDVLLKKDLDTYTSKAARDSVKHMTQERKTTTNFTLTNIHKDRMGTGQLKPHFYDVSNFSLSYAYSGENSSDEDIDHYNKDQHRGTLNYAFSPAENKPLQPFDKVKLFQDKNFKILKDINIFYRPKNFSFSTEMYRDYEETLLRNKSAADIILKPTYYKQFTWRRTWGLQYDLSKSIHFNYNANANARIDEPVGALDTRSKVDSVWQSVFSGGTMENYTQTLSATWDLPVNKLPYFDFLQVPLSYQSQYNYLGTTQALASQGATLRNNGSFTGTATATLSTLYNKISILKKANIKNANNNSKGKKPKQEEREVKGLKDAKDRSNLLAPNDQAKQDSLDAVERKEKLLQVAYFGLRVITGVKNVSVQFNQSNSSQVAGYMGETNVLGMDTRNIWAPGLGYVFGTNTDIIDMLLDNNLFSTDTLLTTPCMNTTNRVISMQASVEPIRDLKIDLNATSNYSSQEQYYYKYLSDRGYVDGPLSYTSSGNYTTSIWSFRTAFKNSDDLFDAFLENRSIVAQRLAGMNPDPYNETMVLDTLNGNYYPAGYSANSQTVLLTSFLATYLGNDAKTQKFSPFLNFPLPNWSINYTGLNKIEWLKQWFSNITLSHRYASTYTIGSFYTDATLGSSSNDYTYGAENILNNNGDYIPPTSMDAVTISEQFNPLLRISVNMVNSFQFNLSVQKNRVLQLSFSNNQLTESTRDGLTFGTGYHFKDISLDIKTGGKTIHMKSDLVLQLNITYNNNKTEIRKISTDISQVSSGSRAWVGEISAEYSPMENLTLRFFFQTNINKPWISNSYPTSTTKGGLTLRFSF